MVNEPSDSCTQWFNLRDAQSGSVHLRLEWLSLLSSADRLSEVRLKDIQYVSVIISLFFAAAFVFYVIVDTLTYNVPYFETEWIIHSFLYIYMKHIITNKQSHINKLTQILINFCFALGGFPGDSEEPEPDSKDS